MWRSCCGSAPTGCPRFWSSWWSSCRRGTHHALAGLGTFSGISLPCCGAGLYCPPKAAPWASDGEPATGGACLANFRLPVLARCCLQLFVQTQMEAHTTSLSLTSDDGHRWAPQEALGGTALARQFGYRPLSRLQRMVLPLGGQRTTPLACFPLPAGCGGAPQPRRCRLWRRLAWTSSATTCLSTPSSQVGLAWGQRGGLAPLWGVAGACS